ncbi:MAG TPA: hypothetical protein PK473_03050 [Nitrosomonas sp.]|nr:hypothetical protein [Agitococcus sp.]HNA69988.1 hypothetical protein [Nitrosomonas sp.]
MPLSIEQEQKFRQAGFTEEEIQAKALQTQTIDPTTTTQPTVPKLERAQIEGPGSKWLKEVEGMRARGLTDSQISQEKLLKEENMSAHGFAQPEIDEYFGVRTPDMTAAKEYAVANFKKFQAENPEKATSIYDAFVAGMQESVVGLAARQKAPSVVLPEDAPRYLRITKGISQMAADWPVMAVGAVGGAAAGTAVGGPVGTFVGGAGTGFALPTALRKIMMDHYEKGDIQNASEFWDRLSSTVIETSKDFAIGVVTAGAGKAVKTFAPITSPLGKTSAALATEAATMTTAGAALEGHLPDSDEFIDGAILALGFHGAVSGASKFRNSYTKSNMRPQEVLREMEEDPSIKGDLFSINKEVPDGVAKYAPKEAEAPPPIPKPEVESPASEAAQNILSKVGDKLPPEQKKLFDPSKAVQNWSDKFDPLKAVDEKAYNEMRQANDYKAAAEQFIDKGSFDFFSGEINGKGLNQVLEPIKKMNKGREFAAYIISKRVVELEGEGGRGIKSGFDLESAKKVIEENKDTFEKHSVELVDFQNRVLDYLHQSGVLSADKLKLFKEQNKAYVPFNRILEAIQLDQGGQKKGAGFLKAIKGSDKAIQNPYISILENLETSMRLAEKNRGIRTLIEGQESIPATEGLEPLFEKVPEKTKAIQITDKELDKALKSQGIEEVAKGFEVFRKEKKYALNEDEFAVYRDGKREVYRTTPDIAAGIKALDGLPRSQNLFAQLARTYTTVKKFGISATPEFQLNNPIRDQFTTGVVSKYGTTPFKEVFSAIGQLLRKDSPEYSEWLRSGGANSAFRVIDISFRYKEMLKLSGETNFLDTAWNVVKTPVTLMDMVARAGAVLENAPRFAEFKKARKAGASLRQAGMESREITLDFQKAGLKAEVANAYIAYLNVGIRGLEKIYTTVKENPAGVGKAGLAYLTTPAIMAWLTVKDDPEYNEIPAWQKANYIIFKLPWTTEVQDPQRDLKYVDKSKVISKDGKYAIDNSFFVRIPLPEVFGQVFAGLPVMMLDSFYRSKPGNYKAVFDSIIDKITPNFIPDLAMGPIEQFANKSLFTGAPIVPSHAEKLLPEEQYKPYTSEISKMLGKAVSYIPGVRNIGTSNIKISSPAVIDNYIQNFLGGTGTYMLQAVDKALYDSGAIKDYRPEKKLSDYPFVKAYTIRYPSSNAQSVVDFRNMYQERAPVYETMKVYAAAGRVDKLTEVYTRYHDRFIALRDLNASLQKAEALIKKYSLMDMDPREKRQNLDEQFYAIITLSQSGNDIMREIDNALKEKK